MSERMTALLDELAGTWEVMAEMEQASKEGRRETLRECSDGLRMLAEIVRKAERLAPQPKTDRESVLEELLRSACAIAERQGAGTAWDRFAASVHAVGLNGITARTYRVLPSDEPAPQADPDTVGELPPLKAAQIAEIWREHGGVETPGWIYKFGEACARAALASAPHAREPLSDRAAQDDAYVCGRNEEAQRWEKAMHQTWQVVNPLNPAGQPGSYARGYDHGFAAALEVLRGNLK